jgi:acyl dehydratase
MGMNFDAIGADNGYGEVTWTHRDTILYALGVGAGQGDPQCELQFTTENSIDVQLQALPAFGVVLGMTYGKRPPLGVFSPAMVLHGEQSFTMHTPLPVQGSAKVSTVLAGIYDKGKGAFAALETTVADAGTGEPWLTSRTGLFIRGEGGFGGHKQPVEDWELPDRAADAELSSTIRPDQTLLYRLSGDRNPLHSDPKFAAKAGFPRPILHGMCTYGVTGRLLVNELCGGDPARVQGMSGRFSKPVMPGDTLTVSIWKNSGRALFQTRDSEGNVVLDRGTFDYSESI